MFDAVSVYIEAMKPNEKVPATVLAKQMAEQLTEFNMTGPQIYPLIKIVLDGYPGIEVKRGATGGVRKLP